MTIYVEYSAGRWNARYWHTDELRYYSFHSYEKETAIKKAIKDTGYCRKDCKIVET